MNLTYSEVEDFLAELHRVAPEKRIALRGRLKHFQRLGWPAGTNRGKGARVEYGIGQTMSLAMGMELLQLGLTPERIVDLMQNRGRFLAEGFADALRDYGPYADPIYYIFGPESLVALRGEPEGYSAGSVALMVSRSKVHEILGSEVLAPFRRFAFINMTDLLDRYIEYFIGRGLADPNNLVEPILNWHEVERKAAQAWQNHVLEGAPAPEGSNGGS